MSCRCGYNAKYWFVYLRGLYNRREIHVSTFIRDRLAPSSIKPNSFFVSCSILFVKPISNSCRPLPLLFDSIKNDARNAKPLIIIYIGITYTPPVLVVFHPSEYYHRVYLPGIAVVSIKNWLLCSVYIYTTLLYIVI